MPHPGTCSIGAELPQDFIRPDGGPTETLSEAPGTCCCNGGDSSAWLLHMRPEMFDQSHDFLPAAKVGALAAPSTLKGLCGYYCTHHDPIEGKSVGKHDLVGRFLRGARRLNPPRPSSLPSWDFVLVLRALQTAPIEPLQSVELKFLSMKTLLLTAMASIKRLGDLQAFSVYESCLEFGPADSSATLRPQPGYVPKVPSTPFRDQVVNQQALPLEETDPALALFCPVRTL